MAAFDKWAQPAASKQRTPKPRMPNITYGSQNLAAQSPFGQSNPFGVVASAQQAAPAGDGFSGMASGLGPTLQNAYTAMATPPPTSFGVRGDGVWSPMGAGANGAWNGAYGQVPDHYGWAGLQDVAKEMTLRLLGQFPHLKFSSGLRDPATNARVNGHPNSGHMRGIKVDISHPTKTGNWREQLAEAAAWVTAMGGRPYLHDAGSGYHLDISWEGVKL